MKAYEALTERRMMSNLPTFARVDGRAFSTFTRGMDRPFDLRMSVSMVNTAVALARETHATLVYTQSDEITLMWHAEDFGTQIWFDGKHSKMVSHIAALASLYFYRECMARLPTYADRLPSFDARVWQVPSKAEAVNVFQWREWDATKNSISMAASVHYSQSELDGVPTNKRQAMLLDRGVNWNDYPAFFKRGTYVQSMHTYKPFLEAEIRLLPPKHAAHTNPGMTVQRREWNVVPNMPPLSRLTNREAFVFGLESPHTEQDETEKQPAAQPGTPD